MERFVPELPEVEIMCRNLRRWLLGSSITIDILDSKWCKEGDIGLLQSKRVDRIFRRAKYIVLSIDSRYLVLHFRMTGKVVLDAPEKRKSARIVFCGSDNKVLFIDRRRLGEGRVLDESGLQDLFVKLGPDAWPERKSEVWWKAAFGSLKGNVKPAILQQSRIAGIGNILASEILFEARISPFRSFLTLKDSEWTALADSTPKVISAVIERDMADEIGFVQDGAQNNFSLYGKKGEPCPRCKAPIQKTKQSGRFTYWCSLCQPK
ncbi:MAG: hypothetical protein CMK59_11155 [Proteobacteria bacterium]|nr:hypothetical protein [Pseudomonadota bacterium]